jgi:carbonic anhydrase
MDRLEQSVRDDVELVRSNELVRKDLREGTRGFVLDVLTGKVRAVV